jgi:putative inorganic carbon (HCO3(-)) transporter
LLVVPTRYLSLGFALLLVPWLCRWIGYGRLTRRTPVDWPVILIFLMVPVSLWVTPLPQATLANVGYLMAGLATFYSLVNWAKSRVRLRWAAWGLIAGGALLALAAPVSVEWMAQIKLSFPPANVYSGFPLLVPDPIHPNVMAGALVLVLPLTLSLLLFEPLPGTAVVRSTLLFLAMVLLLAVVVLTKSRGGYLGAAVGLGFVVFLRWPRATIGPAALAAMGMGYALYRLGSTAVADILLTTQNIGGLAVRLEIWSRALSMIQDFPLTGIGMGAFEQVANALYPFFLAGRDADIPHAHNLFLQVGVDLGIPGLIAYLALLLSSLWTAARLAAGKAGSGCAPSTWLEPGDESAQRRFAAKGQWRGLGVGLLGSLIALSVHGLMDAATWGTRPAFLAWAVFGLVTAAYNYAEKAALVQRSGSL